MLYLNEKPWDKKEWEIILNKYFDPRKYRKKEFEFKLTDRFFGTKKVDGKDVPTSPPSFNIDMGYTINLKGEDVRIRYAETPSYMKPGKEGGSSEKVDDIGKIDFQHGFLRFNSKKLDLYLFMLLSPNNYTNPTYYTRDENGKFTIKNLGEWPTNANFLFRELNEEIMAADIYDREKAVNDARNYIFNQMTPTEAKELYVNVYDMASMDDAETTPLKKMKNMLLVKASENPELFMQNLDTKVRTIKSKINEAKSAQVIHFDKKKGWWMWSGKGGGKIIAVAKGKDEVTELVKWMNEVDPGTFATALEGKILEAEQLVEA